MPSLRKSLMPSGHVQRSAHALARVVLPAPCGPVTTCSSNVILCDRRRSFAEPPPEGGPLQDLPGPFRIHRGRPPLRYRPLDRSPKLGRARGDAFPVRSPLCERRPLPTSVPSSDTPRGGLRGQFRRATRRCKQPSAAYRSLLLQHSTRHRISVALGLDQTPKNHLCSARPSASRHDP